MADIKKGLKNMKKILLGLAVCTSLLTAKSYTQQDRIHDMKAMAKAMNVIQSGFFYNNYETVASGVTQLGDVIYKIKPPLKESKNPMQRYMDGKVKMTHKIIKKINQKSLTILQRFKSGDKAEALQAYTKIMGQCMKCHREIRHW